jgi:Putative adhesin
MATVPPPYSPSPQEQARQARQAWRAQAAAQKAAVRAQRNYWRAMRRPSITGPVVLITIGIFALLLVSGKVDGAAFWMTYQRWWPLLFIVVGLTMLLEWFLDRNQPYPVRRSMGGVVFLLILAGLAAGASYSHWNLGPFQDQFSDQNGDFLHFMGSEHVNDTEMNIEMPAGAQVQVQNPRGDVNVTESSDTLMHIHSHEAAYTNSDDDAKRYLKSLAPNVTVNGTNVIVRVDGTSNGKSDMTIELPKDASADVNAAHGDVSIAGLKGSVNVTSTHGDVKFEDLGSSAHAHLSKGDFSAHSVQGDLAVQGHMDDVTLSEIRGKVLLDGDFFGDTHLERIEAPVHFHSSRTDIEVGRIAGDLTLDASDLHIQQAQGPLKIVTRSKAIDCGQVYGDVHVENSNGDVTVTSGSPLGTVYINNRHGSINMGVPPEAGFTVEANTSNGDISSDFDLTKSGGDSSHVLTGQVGKGGPKITLASDQGDIHLSKAEAFPALPPLPPLPPLPGIKGTLPHPPNTLKAPPAPPAPGVKHLRAPQGVNEQPAVQ